MARRKSFRVRWIGEVPRAAQRQTRKELADLLAHGLKKPADLIFHHVFLSAARSGPSVLCWGERGCAAFLAQHFKRTRWKTVKANQEPPK